MDDGYDIGPDEERLHSVLMIKRFHQTDRGSLSLEYERVFVQRPVGGVFIEPLDETPTATYSAPVRASEPRLRNDKERLQTFTGCWSDLGVLTTRPKRPDWAPKDIRLKSFSQWREDHHIKVNDLVEAGFYFGGYADCGRCFYCGGGLRNWEDNDHPLVEHARWFPKCGFIRQKIGKDFVDTVQELNQHAVEISFNMVVEAMRKKHLHHVIEETPLTRDPAVKAVVDLGYDHQNVIQVAEECVHTEGNF